MEVNLTTKYSPGDKLYYIDGQKLKVAIVESVHFSCYADEKSCYPQTTYTLSCKGDNCNSIAQCGQDYVEDNYYSSMEELVSDLLKQKEKL